MTAFCVLCQINERIPSNCVIEGCPIATVKTTKLQDVKTELGLAHYIVNHRYSVAPYMLDWALQILDNHSTKGQK